MESKDVIAELNALSWEDPEAAHSRADELLLSLLKGLGHEGVAKAFMEARERVGFWYA